VYKWEPDAKIISSFNPLLVYLW